VVQLQILSAPWTGHCWSPSRFPAWVGRSPQADFVIEEEGVWEWHFQIDLDPVHGVVLHPNPEAFTAVDGYPAVAASLRNGDVIEVGSVKMRFGLSPTRPGNLSFREVITWIALGALCLGQIALIYWLPG
jgi:hypothetical protein